MDRTTVDVIDVDLHESPFTSGDYSSRVTAWNELSGRCPVAWNTDSGGHWVMSSYSSVAAISRDNDGFAHAYRPEIGEDGIKYDGQIGVPRPAGAAPLGIGETDGPLHKAVRQALNPRFTPGGARALEPFIRTTAHALLDQRIESGRIEFVDDLLTPITAMTTVHSLGLPVSLWARSADVFHRMMGYKPGSADYIRVSQVEAPALFADFVAVALERRRNPMDDIVTAVAQIEVDDELLSDEDLGFVIFNLVLGGVDTTTGFISHVLRHLSRDVAARQHLVDHPELFDSAVEEFLRLYGSVNALTRTCTRDTEIDGHLVRRGDRVFIAHAAANRDPVEFTDADSFVPDRQRNRHMAFGAGAHRCLGAHVARTTSRLVVEAVLERIPDYTIDESAVVTYSGSAALSGTWEVPATFTPGRSAGAANPTGI